MAAVVDRAAQLDALQPTEAPPRDMRRCAVCRARLPLTTIACRCRMPVCARHLPSDAHACAYDYRAAQKLLVAQRNPQIVASKLSER